MNTSLPPTLYRETPRHNQRQHALFHDVDILSGFCSPTRLPSGELALADLDIPKVEMADNCLDFHADPQSVVSTLLTLSRARHVQRLPLSSRCLGTMFVLLVVDSIATQTRREHQALRGIQRRYQIQKLLNHNEVVTGIYIFAERPSRALYATSLHPSANNFVISSFLCGSSPSAYATSFHCLSVSALPSLGANLPANCLACLSCVKKSALSRPSASAYQA